MERSDGGAFSAEVSAMRGSGRMNEWVRAFENDRARQVVYRLEMYDER